MSSLAHAQGGPRPAFLPDSTFHPGLQVHAIAEPRGDRRLSFLISVLCYESLAALAILTMQHKEAILTELRTHTDVILDPVKASLDTPAPKPVLPTAPPAGPALPLVSNQPPAVPMPETVPDASSASLPTPNQGSTIIGSANTPGVLAGGHPEGSTTSREVGKRGTGQVIELETAQVQVLHRVDPVYPALARLTKQQGVVVLRMTINTNGVPTDVRMVSGPEVFRAEALRCAWEWRFTAARMGSEPVPAAFSLTLRFLLR